MEVKVYHRKKTRQKIQQIDHIPKFFQLPRSASASKPRTDFSFPIWSFKDIKLVPCSTIDPSSTRLTKPKITRRKKPTHSVKKLVTDVNLFRKKACVQPCSTRNEEDRYDALEVTPNRPCKESSGSPEGAEGVNVNDQLPERDNSSSSSRARSKRERKRKAHFDEVTCPLYTSRKVRRFKIMRFLGLAAPVGSPFNSS